MKSRIKLALVSLLLPVLIAGCSWKQFWTGLGIVGAAGAGAAAVYYATGDVEADVDRSIDPVYDAAYQSLEKNGYNVKSDDKNSENASIDAEKPNGDDVKVKLHRTHDEKTHVSIRAGFVGHNDAALRIWEDMADILGVDSDVTRKEGNSGNETDMDTDTDADTTTKTGSTTTGTTGTTTAVRAN
jgi:hypothetical protein